MKKYMDLIKFLNSSQKVTNLLTVIDKVDQLYVKDINDYLIYKTSRSTNPIEPTYDHVDNKGYFNIIFKEIKLKLVL